MTITATRTSNQKALRQAIDAKLQFHPPHEVRQFFAAAAKFLIEERYWDDRHPITKFDHDLVIQAFHAGFEQFSRDRMRGRMNGNATQEAETIELLKSASGWRGGNLRWRIAKKRLTRLRNEMKRRLVRNSRGEEQPLRGLMFYDSVIRNKYMVLVLSQSA